MPNLRRIPEQKKQEREAARVLRREHRSASVKVSAGAARLIARACGVDHDTEYHERDPQSFDQTCGRSVFYAPTNHRDTSPREREAINQALRSLSKKN